MIRTKSNSVRLNFNSEPIRRMVVTLAKLDRSHDVGLAAGRPRRYTGDLVITSGNDSTHGPGSRHYTDEAIDVRTHNFTSREARRNFRVRWEAALGPQFRVLLEHEGKPNEHFHAQVRKGHTYQSEGF